MTQEVKKKNEIKASFKKNEKKEKERELKKLEEQGLAPKATVKKEEVKEKNTFKKVMLWSIAGALVLSVVLPAVAGIMM